jgi:hypothetical protein
LSKIGVISNSFAICAFVFYNCFTSNGGNADPEAKGNNPTTGLTLLWAHNPFRGNFNHWQVSLKEA